MFVFLNHVTLKKNVRLFLMYVFPFLFIFHICIYIYRDAGSVLITFFTMITALVTSLVAITYAARRGIASCVRLYRFVLGIRTFPLPTFNEGGHVSLEMDNISCQADMDEYEAWLTEHESDNSGHRSEYVREEDPFATPTHGHTPSNTVSTPNQPNFETETGPTDPHDEPENGARVTDPDSGRTDETEAEHLDGARGPVPSAYNTRSTLQTGRKE